MHYLTLKVKQIPHAPTYLNLNSVSMHYKFQSNISSYIINITYRAILAQNGNGNVKTLTGTWESKRTTLSSTKDNKNTSPYSKFHIGRTAECCVIRP